jgi:hypothetical protein
MIPHCYGQPKEGLTRDRVNGWLITIPTSEVGAWLNIQVEGEKNQVGPSAAFL